MLCLLALLASCSAPKEVLYLQDITSLKEEVIDKNYEVIIHKDDLLATAQQRLLGYLVDQNGDIDFPILGRLHVEGLTRMQVTELIKQKLMEEDLIKDPIVTVQFLNFKVSVMGEVAHPGTFDISGDRITLLEALSMAGDLTIYGRRDRVAVIREKDGKRRILYHDLRSSDIFQSPCYYLQQNDIVYVEPKKAKTGQSRINSNNSVGVWLSAVSVLASVTSLLVTMFK